MSKLLLLCGACAVISTVPSTTLAQTWPERPVRVVVPWAPGGITDILARLVAERLTQSFGQPFIVDNRAGLPELRHTPKITCALSLEGQGLKL